MKEQELSEEFRDTISKLDSKIKSESYGDECCKSRKAVPSPTDKEYADEYKKPPSPVLSFGQKAVGLTFNVTGAPEITTLKTQSAALIDSINMLRLGTTNGEKIARYTIAIRHIEEACMRAVGAFTYQY